IQSAVILTSGFAEAGPEGAALQDELTRRARAAGVTFLGPNCLGYANLAIRAAMTPIPIHPPFLPGKVALVGQSGATSIEIVDMAHDSNIGLSMCIATGNEAMLDVAACMDFLVDDDNTQVIMVFAETLRDTATFAAAARRAAVKKKAIVMLKAGATELTAKVAAAHTGTLGDDPAIGFVGCVYSMPWNDKWQQVPAIEVIGRALAQLGKPSAMLNQTLRPVSQKSRDIMAACGVPAAFGGLEAVVRALGHISRWSAWLP